MVHPYNANQSCQSKSMGGGATRFVYFIGCSLMFVDFRRAVLPWSSCLFATSSQPPRGLLAASSQSMDVRPPRPLASRRVCRGPVQSNKPAKPTKTNIRLELQRTSNTQRASNEYPAGNPMSIHRTVIGLPTNIRQTSGWNSNEHRTPNELPSNMLLLLFDTCSIAVR